MTKNYIGFVNDHSGSMDKLATAATSDYNATISAVKDAASREMLDTIVSVVGIGLGGGDGSNVKRQVVISNPHVLKPITSWPTPGGTPLFDGVGNMIELFKSLPDYDSPDVSFLVVTTTDGQEAHSKKYNRQMLADEIRMLQATGRWTFVFRVPKGCRHYLNGLNVPLDNIQEWETTAAGMAASTAATQQSVNAFYAARSSGAKSSNVFYANASAVSATALAATLKDISGDVSLYVVPNDQNGVEIRPFILTKRMEYLKGSAFYQLTKTESRVSETKLIAIRNRTDGKIYSGIEARKLIGMPTSGNARLHPGDHGNFDIFIQSESTNRKLVGGTGVLYWKAIGKPFTATDEAYLQPKPVAPAAPAVVVLPQVAPTNKPTKSPIPVTPKPVGPTVGGRPVKFFTKRDEARAAGSAKDINDFNSLMVLNAPTKQRWFVFI